MWLFGHLFNMSYQSVTFRYREFPVPGIFHFFGGIGTGIGTNWYRKKVSEPVPEQIGTGKKSRNRYRKNLVPKKSTGIDIENIWYRKKYGCRYRLTFWVPSQTDLCTPLFLLVY